MAGPPPLPPPELRDSRFTRDDRNALERGLAQLRKATEFAVGYQPQLVTRAEAAAILDHIGALQGRLGLLMSFARPVDIQAAERHLAEHGLVDEEGNRV